MELQEKINRIKAQHSIVDVVGKYVKLKRSGSNYKGLCPFHSDTNPSLIVSPDKQIVNCFVCMENATDVIGFVQKIEKLSFSGTIDKLYGVDIIEGDSLELLKKMLKNREDRLNNKVQKLSIVSLPENCEELDSVDKVPGYLYRRLSFETIKKFKLKKVSSGLCQGRIIIPIYEDNECKGYVARDYTGNSNLRYYIPESWYISKWTFNIDNIDPDPKKKVIVVEGVFDAMYLTEKGYTNVISILGIKLSIFRVESLLRRGIKNLVLCLDKDEKTMAGQEATKRIIAKMKGIFNIWTVDLPQGKDTDECTEEELFNVFSNLKSHNENKIVF